MLAIKRNTHICLGREREKERDRERNKEGETEGVRDRGENKDKKAILITNALNSCVFGAPVMSALKGGAF